MWAGVVLVLLAGVSACRGTAYSAYQYYEPEPGYNDDPDFYDSYDEDTVTVSAIPTTEMDSLTRIKRFGDPDDIRTLNPEEVEDVKGALRDILYGHKLTTRQVSRVKDYTDIYDYVDRNMIGLKNVSNEDLEGVIQKWAPNVPTRVKMSRKWTAVDAAHWSPRMPAVPRTRVDTTQDALDQTPEDTSPSVPVNVEEGSRTSPSEETEATPTTDTNIKESDVQRWITLKDVPSSGPPLIRASTTANEENAQDDQDASSTNAEEQVQGWATMGETEDTFPTTGIKKNAVTVQRWKILKGMKDTKRKQHLVRTGPNTTTTTTTTTITTTRPPTTTTRSPRMDINAIIAIIANLTYDYDWNLTEQFNKSLIDHGVPTCPTDTTPTTTSTTPSQYDFSNSSVVGKCFVCGLTNLEIPREAFCGDAFAGDFLPLTPVDPRARGQIATFRKYCRYLDVHNYVENPSEPRSIYGRFTGGCGVRWTDLSGIYTQRTCRNRFKPLMGLHYASKRMAKLELALVNVENGCIISPMATLLPLSRGISLYARFHACVCTGSWCNSAVKIHQWKLYTMILWCWLTTRI